MEDIFQVVVFLMIAAIGIAKQFIGKGEKPEEASSPQDVLTELFPEITEEEQQPAPQKAEAPKQPKPLRKKRPAPMRSVAPPPPAAPKPSDEGRKAERAPIRLSNREEARRAFIYSEIFNRKYEQ